jgi:ATP-dependent Lon protease
MTGEISLRGRVMAIGGLKEKTMAALRQGITTVIIPYDNLRDLEEIDQTVRKSLHFVVAQHIDTVLETALVSAPQIDTPVMDIPKDLQNRSNKPTIRQ